MRRITTWPMVQRELEIDAIGRAVADGVCDAVVLQGPAGVGKSRLADLCLELANASGRRTARIVASQAASVLPLGAMAPILPTAPPPDETPAALFDQTRAELLALGGGHRVVLFLDDAHLLDPSSAVLLTHLMDAGAVIVLATIREGEVPSDAVAAWATRPTTRRVDLAHLGPEATGEILGVALGGVVGIDTVRRFHEASGGNPLLLRELVHHALDGGQLRDDSGTWRITGEIPRSRRLADLLATRLAGLSEPARHVVDQLAVCAPLGRAELDTRDDGDALVAALEHEGLIRIIADGDRQEIVLAHPLYGEAVRADLPVLRRRAILLAAARRLEALGAPRREDARRLATWQLDAGLTPDTEQLLAATRFARYAYDFSEVERLATVLWAQGPTAEVAVLLGEAHSHLGHYDDAEAVLSAALPHGEPEHWLIHRLLLRIRNFQFGLCDWKAALAAVQEAQASMSAEHTDELVAQESSVWSFASHPAKALEVMERLAPDTARARVQIALVHGNALASVGRTAEGIAAAVEGFREHSALTEPLTLVHPGNHFANQAFSLVEAGRYTEADQLAQIGFDVTLADNIPVAQIWFALLLGKSAIHQGRIEEAQRWYREGASIGRLHDLRGPERMAQCGLASTAALLGDLAAAQAAMARVDELPPFEFLLYDQAVGHAWTAWAAGDPERARTLLLANAAQAAAVGDVGSASWLWHDAARLGAANVGHHLAEMAARSDSPVAAARAKHVRAMEAGDTQGLAAASRTFEGLGMVLLAAEAASAAGSGFRRDGDQRAGATWAERARVLAGRSPGVRTPGLVAGDTAAPLSGREREVALLAGQGLSSQEIADRLSLSIRTVNNHLGHVYDKLGIHGRDQLVEALEPG